MELDIKRVSKSPVQKGALSGKLNIVSISWNPF